MRERRPIGRISVTRRNPGSFAEHHVQLLQTFADQAVIAIENVRLFNEERSNRWRGRRRQQKFWKSSTLARQSVAGVRCYSREGQPCSSENSAFGALAIHDGDDMHEIVAMRGMPAEFPDFLRGPVRLGPNWFRAVSFAARVSFASSTPRTMKPASSATPCVARSVDIAGARSYLAVPIAKDGILLGSFTILSPRSPPLRGGPDRAAAEFRHPGRHRDRERATIQ